MLDRALEYFEKMSDIYDDFTELTHGIIYTPLINN